MEQQATAVAQHRFCSRCDARNVAEALYCVDCGASLVAQSGSSAREHGSAGAQPPAALRGRRCGGCGIMNPPHAVYCVNCGSGLAQGQAAPVPTYTAAPAARAFAVAGGPTTVVQHIYVGAAALPAELPLLVRGLWFLFVGLWAGQIWLVIAWLLNLTLIGLPLGMWMLSTLPQVMTLRQRRVAMRPSLRSSGASFAVRAVYFIVIGWWLSLLWLELAWAFSATLLGVPLAFLMFERTDTVMTLAEER